MVRTDSIVVLTLPLSLKCVTFQSKVHSTDSTVKLDNSKRFVRHFDLALYTSRKQTQGVQKIGKMLFKRQLVSYSSFVHLFFLSFRFGFEYDISEDHAYILE